METLQKGAQIPLEIVTPALSPENPDILTSVEALAAALPGIDASRLNQMTSIAAKYSFRLPRFYVENILTRAADDPLWELVLPNDGELYDSGTERWDAFQLADKVVDHPRWIQKYRYESLLRVTDYCSGLCRYCYLKNRDVTPGTITHAEIDNMFDMAERSAGLGDLREIILSGGDPLAVGAGVISHLAQRLRRLNQRVGRRITVCIHTREPVWYPQRLLRSTAMQQAVTELAPSSYILHVVHPREVTPALLESLDMLVHLTPARPPLLMTQHPLFRGINNDAGVITQMYDLLDSGRVTVMPYYLIHPFPDGTLPQHRLTLPESQGILRGLASAPGTRVPLLTIPTPMGKCVIGPYEQLVDRGGYYLLHTKDGVPVHYSIGERYNPEEIRQAIPVVQDVTADAR